jgi:16S rRNA (guanine527-N7)-methyltransferase
MVADSFDYVLRAAQWAGITITRDQEALLGKYHDWLATEATVAGGLGPNERARLWQRHVADAILFAIALSPGQRCADIGSGVGLPGLPLAVTNPQVTFDLVDRSGRRCDLLSRIIRVLALENCRVIHDAVENVDNRYDVVVSRAALSPQRAVFHVKRLLEPTGVGLVGLSWSGDDDASLAADTAIPAGSDSEKALSVVAVPQHILDSPVKLLRIEAT